MKTADFNKQFDELKKFKEEHPDATDGDEFLKLLYSRFRKYVKKLNKMNEAQGKIHDGKEVTKEQKDMLKKKKELESSLEEMDFLIHQYIKNFDNHCKLI